MCISVIDMHGIWIGNLLRMRMTLRQIQFDCFDADCCHRMLNQKSVWCYRIELWWNSISHQFGCKKNNNVEYLINVEQMRLLNGSYDEINYWKPPRWLIDLGMTDEFHINIDFMVKRVPSGHHSLDACTYRWINHCKSIIIIKPFRKHPNVIDVCRHF